MDFLRQLQVFAAVAERGGFAKAAEALGLPASSATRAVSELEAHLGVRLLARTTRSVALTDAGREYLPRAQTALAALDEAAQAVRQSSAALAGSIRIAVPSRFAQMYLVGAIEGFVQQHPKVHFDVRVTDRFHLDLVEEGIDLAVVPLVEGQTPNYIVRPLGSTAVVLAASPAYVAQRGAPQTLEELVDHSVLMFTRDQTHSVQTPVAQALHEAMQRGHEVLSSSSSEFILAAARAGLGIAPLPERMLREDFQAGRLQRVLTEHQVTQTTLCVAYPSRRHLPGRVRLFIDALVAHFNDAQASRAATLGG